MGILNDYIGTGTQLKLERPGKGCTVSPCDTIEGPIVELEDGKVLRIENYDQIKEIKGKLKKILFLGDILINYGDFFNRAHMLVPPGYCEEWWVQEVINHRGKTDRNKDCTPGYYNFEGEENRRQDGTYNGGFKRYIDLIDEKKENMGEIFVTT